ncbi:ATP-binding protein [Sphaerisporangium corydalis]|uniref:ATP-binding protein n=1 Tax=Sphaerisporangium corydalis TaxID=1441875 RepID=A0ABV9E9A8_9ACTN|nr:ATP-binding protein [Sphaerisporangium corydalis]
MELLGAVDLPARARSVATARAFVRGLLDAPEYATFDQIELLVSEVLTNAVRYGHGAPEEPTDALGYGHAVPEVPTDATRYELGAPGALGWGVRGVVRLVVAGDGRSLRVEVLDGGSGDTVPSIPMPVDPLSESGRGLWLVQELSSAWGYKEAPAGRTVWFEITG